MLTFSLHRCTKADFLNCFVKGVGAGNRSRAQRTFSGYSFDLESVAGAVFTDLEPQKIMDSVYRFRVV